MNNNRSHIKPSLGTSVVRGLKVMGLLVFISFYTPVQAQVDTGDSLALVALYQSTDGEIWGPRANWNIEDQNVSTWFGVTVVNNRVTRVNLAGRGLGGIIPPEIGNLDSLEFLDLGANKISGVLPPEIGNLKNLFTLGFAENQLSGRIPEELWNLTKLRFLWLDENKLIGEIPPEIKNLSELVELYLQTNRIYGELPSEIGSLTKLREFGIWETEIAGAIPISITDLELTYFRYNKTFLCAPNEIAYQNWKISIGTYIGTSIECQGNINLDSLALVALYQSTDGSNWLDNENWLIGNLDSWSGIKLSGKRVTGVDLKDNQLDGSLPQEIRDLTLLRQLRLDSNNIQSIPSEISELSSLQELGLSGNNLNSLPQEISNIQSLVILELSNNNFSGTIPEFIYNLENLLYLGLGQNQLTGNIPEELFNLTNLEELRLSGNLFSGTLSDSIKNLPFLAYLDLSRNSLIGTLNPKIGQLKYLENLSLSGNQFSGVIPEMDSLSNLKLIDLSKNQLEGNIPDWIVSQKKLRFLFLDDNQLNGEVPINLSNLNLAAIRLADNNMTSLPDFSGMNTLNELSARNNNFLFEDLEPNISIPNFTYSPQKQIRNPIDTLILVEGDPFVFENPFAGNSNTYQWFQEGAPLANGTNSEYSITTVTPANQGYYFAEVNNTLLPGLTLNSDSAFALVVKPATINVSVEGSVVAVGSTALFGRVTLGKFKDQEVLIENPGDDPLYIIDVEVTGDFSLQSTLPDVIPANGSATAILRFTPSDFGLRTGLIRIISNGNIREFQLAINGEGRAVLEVYNVITPDVMDGKHDFMKILNVEFYPENTVTIYNRWGDEVFEIENYDNQDKVFAGVDQGGNDLPDGNYYYVVDPGDGSDPINGFLLIRR